MEEAFGGREDGCHYKNSFSSSDNDSSKTLQRYANIGSETTTSLGSVTTTIMQNTPKEKSNGGKLRFFPACIFTNTDSEGRGKALKQDSSEGLQTPDTIERYNFHFLQALDSL